MKKAVLSLAFAVVCAAFAIAKTPKDPELMKINNKPVKLSEFEYLYQKNNAQQLSTQPVDEYVDLFVTYKLKVADAEAEGIDQTDAFRNEFAGYRRDLSEPYLTDPAALDSLVQLIYDRQLEQVSVSHIMLDRGTTPEQKAQQWARLDSIRTNILNGVGDFDFIATQISIDPSAKRNHGHQGYITAGSYPYTFEDAAYETPVGGISEVIETPFGLHIVKVLDRRPNPGMVEVQHILKLTAQLPEEEQAAKKEQIDSIYRLVVAGADFDSIAIAESEDPGSARRGGRLDWFGAGRMVPEFEEMSFALKPGEISEPFATSYGWHIIKKLGERGVESFDELAPRIRKFIERDERQNIPVQRKRQQLAAKYGTRINDANLDALKAEIKAAGKLDSAMVAAYSADERKLVELNGDNEGATVATLFASLPMEFSEVPAAEAVSMIDARVPELATEVTIEAERNNLVNENAEYRNLLNEYRDGMLLFEISDRNVWTKSKKDREGLDAYFKANYDKYANWEKPKFKGFVIFATNDSTSTAIQEYLAENPLDRTHVAETLRRVFGKDVKVERVLAAQGENEIIDAIAFGGEKPAPKGRWISYFPYLGKVINQPEEPSDERGAVTTDYQNYLESVWVEQLRKKYPVKINKKVLNQFKKQSGQ